MSTELFRPGLDGGGASEESLKSLNYTEAFKVYWLRHVETVVS